MEKENKEDREMEVKEDGNAQKRQFFHIKYKGGMITPYFLTGAEFVAVLRIENRRSDYRGWDDGPGGFEIIW